MRSKPSPTPAPAPAALSFRSSRSDFTLPMSARNWAVSACNLTISAPTSLIFAFLCCRFQRRPHRIKDCFRIAIATCRQISDGLAPDLKELRTRRSHWHLTDGGLDVTLGFPQLLQLGRLFVITNEVEGSHNRGVFSGAVHVVNR